DDAHKRRIEKRVLQPLRQIVDEMFPVLDKRLADLKDKIDDLSVGPGRRDAAQRQADSILAEMLKVLKNMMEVRDFNVNVIQRLKKIIERQQELIPQTEEAERKS